jgi:hypothetical protein
MWTVGTLLSTCGECDINGFRLIGFNSPFYEPILSAVIVNIVMVHGHCLGVHLHEWIRVQCTRFQF